MSRSRRARTPCATGHALAIARWEDNHKAWLEGEYFGLVAKRTDLQDLVGDGGTLWIVISRAGRNGRTYSLSFRLGNCSKRTYRRPSRFGRYAVFGDPDRSKVFASNDAKYLLLSLRFDPFSPIDNVGTKSPERRRRKDRVQLIGPSIQTPRCLDRADIKLLEDFGAEADRWSVFMSYQRTEEGTRTATRLSTALQREGVNVFRDQEALRGGKSWWQVLERAIGRARYLLLVIGRTTHQSPWVHRELRHAIRSGVTVIPIVAGGDLRHWADYSLDQIQVVTSRRGRWQELVEQVLAAIARRSEI